MQKPSLSQIGAERNRSSLRAVVIGSGVGGLATAALLAKQGYQVTVFEKKPYLGGQLANFKAAGFTFDRGTTWYLWPKVVAHFFAQFDHKPSDYYRLTELPERFRLWEVGQTAVDIPQGKSELEEWAESRQQHGRAQVRALLGKAERVLSTLETDIFTQAFAGTASYLQPLTATKLLTLQKTYSQFQSWFDLVANYFSRQDLQTLFNLSFLPFGSSTTKIPALYAALLATQFSQKIVYPMGGFGEVVSALARVGWEQGVKTETATVEKIVVIDGRVKGVKVGGELIGADVVVANPEYGQIAEELLAPAWHDANQRGWTAKEFSNTAWVICLGFKQKLPALAHYNISLGAGHNPQDSLWYPYKKLTVPPTMQCIVASRTDWQIAPVDHENVRCVVPVSPLMPDTPAHRQQIIRLVVKTLETMTGQKLTDQLVYHRVLTNQTAAQTPLVTQVNRGNLATIFGQVLHQRPQTQSKKVAGLFYASDSNHPGPGLSLQLMMAQTVSEQITEYVEKYLKPSR